MSWSTATQKMRCLCSPEHIAFFLIALVIMIPICASDALAQALTITQISGKDGFGTHTKGYRTEYDRSIITFTITHEPGISVDPAYIEIRRGAVTYPGKDFVTCQKVSDQATQCTFSTPFLEIIPDKYKYDIMLKDAGGDITSMDSGLLIVDNSPPKVESFNILPNMTGSGKVSFVHELSDLAYDQSDCSGIKELRFYRSTYDEENLMADHTVQLDGDCQASGIVEYTEPVSEGQQEEITICAMAIDWLGQASKYPRCAKFTVDALLPKVEWTKLLDENDEDIWITGPKGTPATLIANISGDDIEMDSIRATLTELNPSSSYQSMKPDRLSKYPEYVLAEWETEIRLDSTTRPKVSFFIRDFTGNEVNDQKFLQSIIYDDVGPGIGSLMTDKPQIADGLFLAGSTTTFIAQVRDHALYANKLLLDLDEIGQGKIRNDECVLGNNQEWNCYWRDIAIDSQYEGRHTVRVSGESTDDLDNKATQTKEVNVSVDTSGIMLSAEDIKVSHTCPTSEDKLIFQVDIDDSQPPKIAVNASRISNRGMVAGTCNFVDDTYRCSAAIEGINSEPIDPAAYVPVLITDYAGNTVILYKEVRVCLSESEKIPNLVSVLYAQPKTIPDKLDRRTLSFDHPTPIYIPLQLIPKKNVEILGMSVDCHATEGIASPKPYLVNQFSLAPYIAINLRDETGTLQERQAQAITCNLSIKVRQDTTYYINPQITEIKADIPLYNNPLGTIDESVKAKLGSLQKKLDDLDKEIAKKEKLDKKINSICSIAKGMAKADASLGIAKEVAFIMMAIVNGIGWGLKATPLSGLGEAIVKGTCKGWPLLCKGPRFFHEVTVNYIWPLGFPLSLQGAGFSIIKYACMIYSCKLCAFENALNFGVDFTNKPSGSAIDTPWSQGSVNTFSQTTQIVPSIAPEKSIHIARACFCLPAQIYNMKKEKQITCALRRCIEESANVGLPSAHCHKTYQERRCLYVDGASWKLMGNNEFLKIISQAFNAVIWNLVVLILGHIWNQDCRPTTPPGWKGRVPECMTGSGTGGSVNTNCILAVEPKALVNVVCHALGAALELEEIGFFSEREDYTVENIYC